MIDVGRLLDEIDVPMTCVEFMLAGARDAARNDDQKLLRSYLEIAEEQTGHIVSALDRRAR